MTERWHVGDNYMVEGDDWVENPVFFAYYNGRYVARYERAPHGWNVENFDDLLLLSEDEREDYEYCRKSWMVHCRAGRTVNKLL